MNIATTLRLRIEKPVYVDTPANDAPWLRATESNGITLCASCHTSLHNGH